TEVRYRPPQAWQVGNWYHIAAYYKGADRGDLALLVDGRAVGRSTHGSRLARPIDPYTTAIEVEDASGFPPQGWIRVGSSRGIDQPSRDDRGIRDGQDANRFCEVLHYSQVSGNTLVV